MSVKRLSTLTQSLANIYPEWSRIRFDEQSVGQRFLNCCADQLERINKELVRSGRNMHLVTANLGELDWLYRVDLDSDFEFNTNTYDAFHTLNVAPTVSGVKDGVSYAVHLADQNDIETFWYQHVPDRISEGITASGQFVLLYDIVDNAPFEAVHTPHIPGRLFVTLTSDDPLLYVDDSSQLHRAIITIRGITRKGTLEFESLAFPWPQKQVTIKEWSEIDSIECHDVPAGSILTVCSADFINGPYLDFWNLARSSYRKKIDQFWNLGSTTYGSTLDLLQYSTDDIQQLISNVFTTYPARRFELLDEDGINVTAIDMAQQPFSDYLWVVTSGELLCYNAMLTTGSSSVAYREVTDDSSISIQFSEDHTVRGVEVDVEFICSSPASPVNRFRSWVTYPNGTSSGILHGALVPYSETELTFTSVHSYLIDNRYVFTPTVAGEYIYGLEAEMSDGTTQFAKRVLFVDSKEPLAQFALPSGIVGSGVLGIDFDSDQEMWIATQSGFCQLDLHHDVMLVDYENKTLFFREAYDEVEIWK